ncbi:MAG TPA: NAD-dependent epimerase/dehydratase family protein [Candidatus Xenobia bacterium]|nr:NAD-dependent epimerase/dehydratase family protein [Candidatus Xenobia bacterium]
MNSALGPKSTDAQIAAAYRDRIVLVTGGAGCVGSNLCRVLLEAGVARVVVLDDLSAAERWNLPASDRLTFIQGSVTDAAALARAFDSRPAFVFHLAAFFANQNSVEHPEEDLEVNGRGTLRVLEAARAAPVERVVYASSGCSVYGARAPLPLKEDFVSLHLDTPYQITKLLGELYCNFFHHYHGLPVVRARLFNVYGPGEIPGRYRNVIPNFLYWALNSQPLPLTGTGEETRDFTYVGDICSGLLRCGALPQAVGEAINLASGVETKIIDLANQINALTSNSAGLRRLQRRRWDTHDRRRASIEKARELLGYQPRTDFAAGLRHTLAWFQNHRREIEAAARF